MPGISYLQMYLAAGLITPATRSTAASIRTSIRTSTPPSSPPSPPQHMTLEEAQALADFEDLSLDFERLAGPPVHQHTRSRTDNRASGGYETEEGFYSDDEDDEDDDFNEDKIDEAAVRTALAHVSTPIPAPTSSTSAPRTADEEANECPICRDTLVTSSGSATPNLGSAAGAAAADPDPEAEALRLNACAHAFHTTCLAQWLCADNSCPYCRAAVLPAAVDAHIRGGWPQSALLTLLGVEDEAASASASASAGHLYLGRAGRVPASWAGGQREEHEEEMEGEGEDGDSGVALTEPFYSRDDHFDDDEWDEDDGVDVDARWYMTAEQQRMMARYGVAERELEAARRTVPSGW